MTDKISSALSSMISSKIPSIIALNMTAVAPAKRPAVNDVPPLYIIGLTLTFVVLIYFLEHNKPHGPFPPGPQRRTMVGNLLDMNTDEPWKLFTKWKAEYGESHVYGLAL